MKRREITEAQVFTALYDSIKSVTTRANRLASYAQVRGKYIVVIQEKENDEDVILTVMRVDRRRLARFGFTQV